MKRLIPLFALLVLGCDRSTTNVTATNTPNTVALSARFLATSVASVDSVEAKLVRSGHPDVVNTVRYVKGGSIPLANVTVGDNFTVSMAGFDSTANGRAHRWWGTGADTADASSASKQVDISTQAAPELAAPVVSGTLVGSTISLAAGTWYTTDGSDPRTSKSAQQASGAIKIDKACTIKAATKSAVTATTPALWSNVTSSTFQDSSTTPVLSSDAALTDIVPSVASLSPTFSSAQLAYTVTLPAGNESVQLTPAKSNSNATVLATFAKDGSTVVWPIKVTDSVRVNLTVTAQDGMTKKVYTVKLVPTVISVVKSSDATLANIIPSTGSLSSKFEAKTLSYVVALPAGFDTARIAVTKGDVNASIVATLKDGNAATWPVKVTDSVAVNLTVTAQDGISTQTYVVLFRKAPVIKPNLTRKTPVATDTIVSNLTTSLPLSVNVVSAHLMSVTINGKAATLSNGSWNGSVTNLPTSLSKIWAVAIDSTGGKDSLSWNITRALSGDATLSSIKPSAGTLSAFDKATIAYTLDLPAGIDTTRLSFTTSEPNATVAATMAKDASTISWPLTITDPVTVNLAVTAQDKSTKTYAVTIKKAALVTPTLTRMSPFATDTTVPSTTTTLTLKVDVVSAHLKSVTIGNKLTAGLGTTRTATVSLNSGVNTIDAVATDSTGGTNSLSWKVTRALSSDAALASLKASTGPMSSGFSKTELSYSMSIGTDTTRLIPTLSDANAKLAATLEDGTPVSWPLTVKDSIKVNLKVTAQDGTVQTYSVMIHKLSQVVVQCSLPTDAVLTRPTYPIFSLASDVDTTGVRLVFTKDGTDPAWTTASAKVARSTPWWVGVAGPSTVKVSPWKNGIQVGPVQTFTWTATTVTFDFNTIDTGTIGTTNTDAITLLGVSGYVWTSGTGGSATPSRTTSTLGTTGTSFKLAYNISGTSYPSDGFGFLVPWNPISGVNEQDLSALNSITVTFKDVRASASKMKPLRIDINVSQSNPTLYAPQQDGLAYGWEFAVTGAKQTITLPIADAKFPDWATSSPTGPISDVLKNFESFKFSENCIGTICTNVTGTIEVDDIKFNFK